MTQDHEELFRHYLDICNQAMAQHQDRFPYKQIWEATENALDGEPITVAVFDDRPQAAYQMMLHNKQIRAVRHHKQIRAWRFNLSYLQEVVQNPERYISNPAKLDWDWLSQRINSEECD